MRISTWTGDMFPQPSLASPLLYSPLLSSAFRLKSSWWRSADITRMFPTQLCASNPRSSCDSLTLRPHFVLRLLLSTLSARHAPAAGYLCSLRPGHTGEGSRSCPSLRLRGSALGPESGGGRAELREERRRRERSCLVWKQAIWTELQVCERAAGGITRSPVLAHLGVLDIYLQCRRMARDYAARCPRSPGRNAWMVAAVIILAAQGKQNRAEPSRAEYQRRLSPPAPRALDHGWSPDFPAAHSPLMLTVTSLADVWL